MSNREFSKSNSTQSYNKKWENKGHNNISRDDESIPEKHVHKQTKMKLISKLVKRH